MGIIEMIKGNNNAIKDTPDAEIEALFAEVQTNYMTFKTHDMNFRKTMLKSLKKGLQVLEEEIIEAVHADLGQPPVDAYASNIMPVMAELDVAIQNIDSWVKPKHVKGPLLMFPGSMSIKQEPLGVVLVMGSWNYPFQHHGISGIRHRGRKCGNHEAKRALCALLERLPETYGHLPGSEILQNNPRRS